MHANVIILFYNIQTIENVLPFCQNNYCSALVNLTWIMWAMLFLNVDEGYQLYTIFSHFIIYEAFPNFIQYRLFCQLCMNSTSYFPCFDLYANCCIDKGTFTIQIKKTYFLPPFLTVKECVQFALS